MRLIRRLGLLPLLSLVLGIGAIGCSSGGASTTKGGGGGSTAISVALSTAPPSSLQASATTSISATVSNDSANKGVTWSCAPANACGSFSPAQTASGASTTYTAPANAPQSGSVTITATSVADTTKSSSTTVSITAAKPAIAVSFSAAPPSTLATSATATIAATVANDSANKGVTWSCAPANACGSFNPTQTASGTSTTYTAPASATPNTPQGFAVTLTATSISDGTKNASAILIITTTQSGAISVTLTTIPSGESIQTGATAAIAATVSNDPTNAGVAWSCFVASGDACGSFNPAQTASAASTTYTAPAAVPQSNLVTITATSVADNTKSASFFLTAYAAGTQNSLLKGKYALLLTGSDATGGSALAASLNLDGNGNVTSGVQDFVDAVPANAQLNVQVAGTYAIYANGRGVMTLNVTFQNTSFFENFSLAATSGSHAVVSEVDGTFSSTGSLDLQSAGPNFSLAQIAGNYSFMLSGEDIAQGTFEVEGGIVTLNASGNLTSGTIDVNDNGVYGSSPINSGTFSAPDSNGRGTITTNGGSTFAYYIVTPEVLRLVETDALTVAGGSAYGQGTATTFTNASLSGSFVFHDEGFDSNTLDGSRVVAGQFTTDSNGNFTSGVEDSNAGGNSYNVINLAGVTYSIPNSPRGTVTFFSGAAFNIYLVDPNLNMLDPNSSSGGGGALLLETDAISSRKGEVIPQASPASSTFTGSYALNLANLPVAFTGAQLATDLVGQLTVNSSGTSGFVDYCQLNSPPLTSQAATASSLTADSSNPGRFTGTLTVVPPSNGYPFALDSTGGTTGQINVTYFQISSTQLLVLGTSATEAVFGVLEQ